MIDSTSGDASVARFALEPAAPFRLDLTAWCLRKRPDSVVDRFEDGIYRRVIAVGPEPVAIAVRQAGSVEAPRLEVEATGRVDASELVRASTRALDRALGLGIDLTAFFRFAEGDPQLGPLVARLWGIRPPCYPSAFEALVNAIACQQITLTVGIRVLNRLAERYGLAFGDAHAFPRPEDLAEVDPSALRELGFSSQKARSVVEAARSVASGDLDLEGLADLDDEAAISRLVELRGVGRWTAEYVLVRGLGRTHVFPGDDSGFRGNLRRWLDLPTLDVAGTRQLLARWYPYAGLVYLCLLARRLIAAGYVQPSTDLEPGESPIRHGHSPMATTGSEPAVLRMET
jgi:DNA-3-methyladenine glycosylase II